MQSVIWVGQDIAKDCVVGDRLMNRYSIFNGLELPRRIDSNLAVTLLGVRAASDPVSVTNVGAGNIPPHWYSWKAVYASAAYLRPVPSIDGSSNYTRGNPSINPVSLNLAVASQVNVVVPGIAQAGITHILLYRSIGASTQAESELGPYFYVTQALNAAGNVTILDNVLEDNIGLAAETDNFVPSAYRYAVAAQSYIFAGGNFPIGKFLTCTVIPGSSIVTVDSGTPFYDGIYGWRFKLLNDTTGGVDGSGFYFANYVSPTTIQLTDSAGTPLGYNGSLTGSGLTFQVALPGHVLRWCKRGEPEAWPATNLIDFEGEITGIAQLPNRPILILCTDEPSVYALNMELVGTQAFKTNKNQISTEHTVTSHYSLVGVESALRGIDAHHGCIMETDGSAVYDISSSFVPKVFDYLSNDMNDIQLWHCAYDHKQGLFGAFVTFKGAARLIDFCIGQNVQTKSWFFNFEKDLLCSGIYIHPDTGESLVLGGTQGSVNGGGVWGRIWCPHIYSEWIPSDTLLCGTITNVVNSNVFDVDNSALDLYTTGDGLMGRWVLVCDPNGEYAQVGYIYSNTANRISVDAVVNSLNPNQFIPIPAVGWKFYLGLIECRWGPKVYDFGDPDVLKKVWEVWCTVSGHDETKPPFIRLYRGLEKGYTSQLELYERTNMDKTKNQSFVNKTSNKLESVARWGVAWYDRSYKPTILRSLTIVFNPTQEIMK